MGCFVAWHSIPNRSAEKTSATFKFSSETPSPRFLDGDIWASSNESRQLLRQLTVDKAPPSTFTHSIRHNSAVAPVVAVVLTFTHMYSLFMTIQARGDIIDAHSNHTHPFARGGKPGYIASRIMVDKQASKQWSTWSGLLRCSLGHLLS